MIPWIGAVFLVVGFVIVIWLLGLVERSRQVMATARRSLGVIRDSSLSDDAKEVALRKDAIQLFGLFFILATGGAAAVFLPMGLVWLGDLVGWISLDSVFQVALSPVFLIVSGIFAVAALFWGSRRTPEASDYSALDRLVHRVAFGTYAAQVSLADLEDQVFAKRLARCSSDRPVFITALPRAGTTLLLECCAKMPEFASHCYRDMPFVLIPCLWSWFSSAFRKSGELRERTHGDGMLINFDSPEALEEVLWKSFWRRHYLRDRIVPWQNDDNDEFNNFFRSHMRKIILLRRPDTSTARYVSKNNLNIARATMLRRIFPNSIIVVPFRHPVQHAASLLQQHRNFLRIHQEDHFACEYMRAIGHYDFGKNLCPVDFDGWFDRRESQDLESLAFWLEYWVVSYRHLLSENAELLNFFCYEELCDSPERGLKVLAETIDSRDPGPLLAAAADIRGPRPREVDTETVPEPLLQEADDVYARLKDVARY